MELRNFARCTAQDKHNSPVLNLAEVYSLVVVTSIYGASSPTAAAVLMVYTQ